VTAIAAALAVAFALLAGWLAPRVPFEFETRLAGSFAGDVGTGGEVESYLQGLAGRLAKSEQLPDGMVIKVHYRDEPVVNAFATLGGHIVMYRGLLKILPDENTLAMVLAHEIAHIKHRHPVTALGRGLAMAVVVSTLSSAAGSSVAGRAMGEAGLLTQLSFSRAQEEQSDATALAAVVALYGHAGGSSELFALMRKAAARASEPPKLLSTHPLSEERTARLASLAQARQWPADGMRTALPAAIRERPAASEPKSAKQVQR